MNVETSLSWQGPYWYAGRRPRRADDTDVPEDLDISLVGMFERESVLPRTLPAAIVIDLAEIHSTMQADFLDWLLPQVKTLDCEVPFFVLTGSEEALPDRLQTVTIVDRIVPDDILLMLICIHQRALLRSEEAQLRRRNFGRIPGFGTAPHQSGSSCLMVVGLSGRFLEWQDAGKEKVDVIGAFDGNMAVEFMAQRAFDAVVVDAPFDNAVDYMQQIKRDSRFAGLPVIAVSERGKDTELLFRNGASDVIAGENLQSTLASRLYSAIRFGKRKRLADRILAESRLWLSQQANNGGLEEAYYSNYLRMCNEALALRGLQLREVRLQPESFGLGISSPDELSEAHAAVLSIADATSRDEDLVCLVKAFGPVAVVKNEDGTEQLLKRVRSILSHTTF